jgi:hypothetical protein
MAAAFTMTDSPGPPDIPGAPENPPTPLLVTFIRETFSLLSKKKPHFVRFGASTQFLNPNLSRVESNSGHSRTFYFLKVSSPPVIRNDEIEGSASARHGRG